MKEMVKIEREKKKRKNFSWLCLAAEELEESKTPRIRKIHASGEIAHYAWKNTESLPIFLPLIVIISSS